ncbi:UNVERIFIED_CONTAM: hypothetical protein GTU68_046469 [Idotea baltica]|nr:hypothetical protein [Idotea baltica]
MGICLHLVTQL